MRTWILVVYFVLTSKIVLADPVPQSALLATPSLQPVASWAIPGNLHFVGYYVGGGCARPHRADGRAEDEGTWGWDYRGWLIPRDIVHGWWHGRRKQGGSGAYRTDGPHYHATSSPD